MRSNDITSALSSALARKQLNVHPAGTDTADRPADAVTAEPACRCHPPLNDSIRAALEGVPVTCTQHPAPTSTSGPAIALNDDAALTALALVDRHV